MDRASTESTIEAIRYDVILADLSRNLMPEVNNGGGYGVESYSSTMTVDALHTLPVSNLAAEDSALFIWVRFPIISNAYKVINEWGFEYRASAFVWHKAISKEVSSYVISKYTHPNENELCLLAIRGKMPVNVPENAELIKAPVRENGLKPYEQHERIERLYPGAQYLELFAKQKRTGWHSWNN